jgi:hypothetical protein
MSERKRLEQKCSALSIVKEGINELLGIRIQKIKLEAAFVLIFT